MKWHRRSEPRHRTSGAACGQAPFLLVFLFFSLLIAGGEPGAWAAAQAPNTLNVKNYISDFANVLSAGTRDRLNALAAEVDRKADAQIAVVTVKTLDGKPIEDYSIDLATRLGVGPKASNRGVMILLAVNDHQYRIEVGYGLEGILPDGKVGGFGREAVPYLRENNYDAALQLMTRRVADVIAMDRGVTLTGASPAPLVRRRGTNLTGGEIILLFAAIFFVFSILRRASGGGSRFNQYGGRYGGGGGWWIGPMMGGGGWGGGGFGGGGGGGGGGFGGFGGGSFGGGGASGSW